MSPVMSHVPREFFTVDLRGLRAALTTHASERGVTESDILRSALAASLDVNGNTPVALPPVPERPPTTTHVKLSVRLSRLAAHHLNINARSTGLPRRVPDPLDCWCSCRHAGQSPCRANRCAGCFDGRTGAAQQRRERPGSAAQARGSTSCSGVPRSDSDARL